MLGTLFNKKEKPGSNEQAGTFDVIAIGDTTQDIFLKMSEASLQCDIDGTNCRICFDYAEKIAVDKKTDIPAVGNAANHAIGIARLGLKSAIYTVVGDDEQGKKCVEVFEKNKVDSSYLVFDKERETNLSMVINYKSERTIFVYHEPRDYKLPELADTKWIYLTSASGDGLTSLHDQVGEYLDKNPAVKLAFNPGTHQIHLGREKLLPLLAKTDILFLNVEESARILEKDTQDVKELIKAFHDIGVKMMVMTDGPKGAYVSDGNDILFVGIYDGPVVERTGCGDSYASGFLAALIKGKEIKEAMLWGNSNSTSVVKYIGAREGLLEEDAIHKMIEENSDVKPEKFNS